MNENQKENSEESFLFSTLPSKKALLVSIYTKPEMRQVCEEHLNELEFLVETYGIRQTAKFPCQIKKFEAATYVTKGKLEELVQFAQTESVDLVIFDDEISPAQQRNLEKIFKLPVIDRTEVILGVFAQRAQTREARLQVQLAQIKYEAPRLKRLWTHLSRQKATTGGGAYLKGEGEKQIEIDRRILKRKIERLQSEIQEVKAHRKTQRISRKKSEIPIFALIGYTNAGKSTLLNALTEAGVFVEDKLFATLDTTTRKFLLSNNQEILLIDTVGFIRKLPHLLVAAFKSTLEEATQADILLHIVDASHPMAEEQAATTLEVLKELNASDRPMITVLNKVDLVDNPQKLIRLRMMYPKNIQISALHKTGLSELQEMLVEELKKQRKILKFRVPQREYAIVTEIMRLGKVIHQEYEENDVVIQAEVPALFVGKYKEYLIEN